MKIIALFLIMVLLLGCGTDTASGPGTDTDPTDPWYPSTPTEEPDRTGGVDIIDSNPVIDEPGTNPDDNVTDPDDGTGGGDPVITDSIFDVIGAELDPFACMIGDPNEGFTDKTLLDRSSDDTGAEHPEHGGYISSGFPYSREDPTQSEAVLYYYALKPERQMDMANIFEDDYILSFDKAWAQNDETKIYVMTPKNAQGFYGCYRYDVSMIDQNQVVKTKVYRNKS